MNEGEPIRRRKLSHEILDRLLARITRGELAAGEHLPSERDLMVQYQVGRPAVREAMQALERMGLIAITHGERARIVAPSARTIIEQIGHTARHLLATSPTGLQEIDRFDEVNLEGQIWDVIENKINRRRQHALPT